MPDCGRAFRSNAWRTWANIARRLRYKATTPTAMVGPRTPLFTFTKCSTGRKGKGALRTCELEVFPNQLEPRAVGLGTVLGALYSLHTLTATPHRRPLSRTLDPAPRGIRAGLLGRPRWLHSALGCRLASAHGDIMGMDSRCCAALLALWRRAPVRARWGFGAQDQAVQQHLMSSGHDIAERHAVLLRGDPSGARTTNYRPNVRAMGCAIVWRDIE